MRANEVLQGFSNLSVNSIRLVLRQPSKLRHYLSHCMKKYEELAGTGLPCGNPPAPASDRTFTLPTSDSGGGMSFQELVILARTTRAMNPKTIFEVGTYNGLSTAVFLLNASSDARIFTLDLPLDAGGTQGSLPADKSLIATRPLASVPQALGLHGYHQLLCDSMAFDPSPYLGSVDLGLIDGAHDLLHVHNDTVKMVRMMSENGVIFWHDYGGRVLLGPLTSYLESLGKQCPLYRIPDTNFAWALAQPLKKVVL
jgi:Methyltransferase domain